MNIGEHEGKDNIPLAGAKITLLDIDGKVFATTYTVEVGEFAFYDVADCFVDLYRVVKGENGKKRNISIYNENQYSR